MDQYLYFFHCLLTTSLLAAGLGLPKVCVFAYELHGENCLNYLNTNEIKTNEKESCFTQTGPEEAESSQQLSASSFDKQMDYNRNHSPPVLV